jgi:hypothetical protein
MSHARRGKILFIPGTRPDRFDQSHPVAERRERKARAIVGASILGALAMFWVGATLSQHEQSASIRSLPASERQSLYTHTLDELTAICREHAAATGELHDHCVAQARFLMELPECGDGCQSAAAAVLPHARR